VDGVCTRLAASRSEYIVLSKTCPYRYGLGPTLMAQKPAPTAADHAWASFESEALPHVDRPVPSAIVVRAKSSEAEDLVQETMMQALQSFHRFQPGTNCRAWLTTILQHVRSNRRRARSRSPSSRIRTTDRSGTPFVFCRRSLSSDGDDLLGALRRIPAPFQESDRTL